MIGVIINIQMRPHACVPSQIVSLQFLTVDQPTDPFTTLELYIPPHDVPELYKFANLQVLKLKFLKGSVGYAVFAALIASQSGRLKSVWHLSPVS